MSALQYVVEIGGPAADAWEDLLDTVGGGCMVEDEDGPRLLTEVTAPTPALAALLMEIKVQEAGLVSTKVWVTAA